MKFNIWKILWGKQNFSLTYRKMCVFNTISLSAKHRTSTCFTRGVLAESILHEQMISFVRESNDSPSEFLHSCTCVTEKVLTWPRIRDISRDVKSSSHRSRRVGATRVPITSARNCPCFAETKSRNLPAERGPDPELAILIFHRKRLMHVPICVSITFVNVSTLFWLSVEFPYL